MKAETVLLCRGLYKKYGRVTAVDGIDLEVGRGECFGLLGPNGAGKTTTVEILEGLTKPTAGTVSVLGRSWTGPGTRSLRERLGVALQETQFPERLTVCETVRLFRSFYGKGMVVEEAISLLGLYEKRDSQVRRLSGGQQRRLALACSLVGDPDVFFLDEPTTGLDPQARLRIWETIENFVRMGRTVVLTTHYMDEAQRLCGRVAIIDRGRIIARGTPADLIETLGAGRIVELKAQGIRDAPAFSRVPGVLGLEEKGDSLVMRVDARPSVVEGILAEAAAQNAGVTSLETHRATLEDVFVHLTGRGLRDE